MHYANTELLPALFLCRQDGLETAVPVLPHLCNANDPSLHAVHIKYLTSHIDLQRLASCLHLLPTAYSAIVVEDVSSLIRGAGDDRNTLVRTLALLLEGIRAYRASSGCGPRCRLLVTDSGDEGRRPRYIFDRWFPLTILALPYQTPQGSDGCFCLSAAPQPGGQLQAEGRGAGGLDATEAFQPATRGPKFVYRADGGGLVLEAVHVLG